MNLIKKNQVVIYVIALMLVVAGYLNFTASNNFNTAIHTSSSEEELTEVANIGDAQLVSSNVYNEVDTTDEDFVDTSSEISKDNNVIDSDKIVDSSSNIDRINDKNNIVSTNVDVSKGNNDDYFTTSKLERDTMYSQMLETYEKVLNSTNSLETQRQSASEEITKINTVKNRIMICENLIKIKGFDNSLIFVNGDSVSVIVEDEQLSPEKVAQIQNIISREMNAKIDNIHISSK